MSGQTANRKPAGSNAFDLINIDSLAATLSASPARPGEQVLQVDPAKTRDNPYQPRQARNPVADAELEESAKEHGIQQPIIVLPADDQGVRTVVFGHRRRDAAQAAGIHCPAIERAYKDEQLRVVALVENLQREDMIANDEVRAVANLAAQVGNTKAAALLGRRTQYVSKIVTISKSAAPIRELLASGYSTDIAAFYELSLLHNKDAGAAQQIIDRWNKKPEQRVSLRTQVAEAKAKTDGKDKGGATEKVPPKAKPEAMKEASRFGSMGFEPVAFHVEKLANGATNLVLQMSDGPTVGVAFSQSMWHELRNAVNT